MNETGGRRWEESGYSRGGREDG
jgi:hypothetical protein